MPNKSERVAQIKCSLKEKLAIDNEIKSFLEKGIISKTVHCTGEFISQIFPRDKKSGGIRIILNLSKLNENVKYEHFKMESLGHVINLIEPNCFMGSIDLTDAYYTVSIHPDHRKYLKFVWDHVLYQFNCLPNGLSCAPRVFTKLLKPIFDFLRKKGHVSVYYIDDSWVMANSYEECLKNITDTAEILSASGFIVNERKSEKIPSQKIKFLGFYFDSVEMTISLPREKRQNLFELCLNFLEMNRVKIRHLAKLIGVIVSCLPAVRYGKLFYRYLEINRNEALRVSYGNFDEYTFLNDKSRDEISWWQQNIHSTYNLLRYPAYDTILTTDASLLGWGAVFQGTSTGGQWNSEESNYSINALELLAVLFGLKSFKEINSCVHVRVQSDNVTAVTYINNQGGIKSVKCHEISLKIWIWAKENNFHISAEHLPGYENVLADRASRIFDLNTEWSLDHNIYMKISNKFGPFEIDLFASRLNAKHENYASWKPDPHAMFIDAFSRSWENLYFYAFPPFSLITRVLSKIQSENAQGVVIVPFWTTQPWYPKLQQMLMLPPLNLP